MNPIVRTALASLGAVAVVAGGGLAVADANAPATPHPSPSSADQVASLNKQADEILAQVAQLEKELSSPHPTASASSTPVRQELSYGETLRPSVRTADTKASDRASDDSATERDDD